MFEVDDLRVAFGGVRAVDGVSLAVGAGTTLGLIGPNGSGKSTFLNGVCGFVPATGRVAVAGAELRLGHPMRARQAGIVRTFQTPQVAPTLTCLENVVLAHPQRRRTGAVGALMLRRSMRREEHRRWSDAAAALERVGMTAFADVPANALSYGQRRLVELARVITASPRVVLLDEPTAGLNEAETVAFAALLGGIRSDDLALVVVDHKVDFLDRLCDQLVVLELGNVIATGAPSDVWRQQRVVEAYLGWDEPEAEVGAC